MARHLNPKLLQVSYSMERGDWPQAVAYLLGGSRDDFADCGPEEVGIALRPGIGRIAFRRILAERSAADEGAWSTL